VGGLLHNDRDVHFGIAGDVIVNSERGCDTLVILCSGLVVASFVMSRCAT